MSVWFGSKDLVQTVFCLFLHAAGPYAFHRFRKTVEGTHGEKNRIIYANQKLE